jgi:hypothetical protein
MTIPMGVVLAFPKAAHSQIAAAQQIRIPLAGFVHGRAA